MRASSIRIPDQPSDSVEVFVPSYQPNGVPIGDDDDEGDDD